MFKCNAVTAWRAAPSLANCLIEPTTILRCLRLPSGPFSLHLNSHTAGLPCRSVRIILPFCISVVLSMPALEHSRMGLIKAHPGTNSRTHPPLKHEKSNLKTLRLSLCSGDHLRRGTSD